MKTNETVTWTLVMINVVLVISISQSCVHGEPQVPCFFIFGDSLEDNGNNNHLKTVAKVNYTPYGIDYPKGPTGRFCNGRTNVDILAELLGFENPIPGFATASEFKEVIRGVNYASASAGIRDETGAHVGENVNLNKQLLNHKTTIKRITSVMGLKELAKQHLQKCIYSLAMGSNDYLNNYFQPTFYSSNSQYNPEQYATLLIQQYTQQIMTLYKYGARKVVLNGVGQVGCTPYFLPKGSANRSQCDDKINNAVQIFNTKLKSIVDQLNAKLTDAKFIYFDNFGLVGNPPDPKAYGFKVSDISCCPVNQFGQCDPSKAPCTNRNEYMFWDAFHTTEAFNLVTATKLYNSSNPSDTHPMNLSHLVQLKL